MKYVIKQLPLLVAVCLLNACGGNADKKKPAVTDSSKTTNHAPAVPVVYSWGQLEKLDQKEMDSALINGEDARIIVIEGYLSLPSSIYMIGKNIRCDLFPRYNQAQGIHANLEFDAGTENNQMQEVPKKYTQADFKIRTDSGQIAGEGSYVKVTGKLLGKYDDYATLNIVKIEKAMPQPVDYSAAAELKADNLAALNNKLVYVDGTLEAGYFLGLFTSFYYSLDIKQTNLPADVELRANVRIGHGSGQIEELPDKFTNKDIRIHNQNGNLLPFGKKLRITGVFKKSDSGNGGDIYVEHLN